MDTGQSWKMLNYIPFKVAMLILILLLLPLLLLMKKKAEKGQLPPSPSKLPIIGNLHQLGKLPHQSLWQFSKTYGHVMLLQLGFVPTLVVSSAETAKELLNIHDLDCCSRPPLVTTRRLSYNCLDMGFAPYGGYWREVRKICFLELFSTKRVQSFQLIREEEVALLISSISQSTPFDLSEKLYSLTRNITCKTAFGKSFHGGGLENGKFQDMVHEAQAMLGSFSASDFFPYVGWIVDRLSGLHKRLERIFHQWDFFFQQVIDDHLDPDRIKQEEDDIVDVLLRIEMGPNEFGTAQLTKNHIKAILMDIFLAGVDTAAITMIWAMTELVRNSGAMKKVQDEVRSCIGKKGTEAESDINELQYLKMVVKETLRLHPPVPLLLPREAMNPFKINGFDIFPKTRVQVNVWAIGRDPGLWENPEVFFPERFLHSSTDFKRHDFKLLPFGAGRRGCPGIYMGTTTVEIALANLLYHLDWELPNGMKEKDINMEEEAGLTVHKKSALKLVAINHQWPSKIT